MKSKAVFILFLLVCTVISVNGQKKSKKITITGYVYDYRQIPVQNAMIIVDDKKTDYVTDAQGFYKARVTDSAVKIGVFTIATGLKEEEIKGRTKIDFVIPVPPPQGVPPSEVTADNEVVNIGYGNVKKRDLTTNVDKINGTQSKYASYTDIYEMIRGEVAGVQVQGKSIKIQGVNSMNSGTQPLFIVDGAQVGSIDNIQPQIVKSIEILKGASAAIYGVRAANGVILITTIK